MSVVSGQSNGTVEVTPSGIPIFYQSQPKRLYRVGPEVHVEYAEQTPETLLSLAQAEDTTWVEVPSVTTVLGVLDKPALPWWGMKVGIEGVLALNRQNVLVSADFHPDAWDKPDAWDVDSIVESMTRYKLTVNHVRDKAGDRGQAVHDALENWARHGHMPDPFIYPEEQEGYVRGLVAFLKDVPSAEPEGAEVLVASSEYGFAGRYDLRLKTSREHEVVVRRTATKVRKRTLLPGRLLADLKTSKGCYPTHALQLEAYETASLESGYESTDGRGILLVTPDGHYEFIRSWASADDFLNVLAVYQSLQEMAKRKKAA